VTWLRNENGLSLARHGSILSSGEFRARQSSAHHQPCSLEIWLQPASVSISSTLLNFYGSPTAAVRFSFHQWTRHLWLQNKGLDDQRREVNERLLIPDILHEGKPVFVAISSGADGTAIYADGVLARRVTGFTISSDEFTGRLVVADNGGWSGQLLGLAIYSRELSLPEILEHGRNWATQQGAGIVANESPFALFLFDERKGNVVHNRTDSATDLVIPERYFSLHAAFLALPWEEIYPGWGYWKYAAINVVGFVPFGFFFRAYLSAARKTKAGIMSSVILGFAVSLTIEVLQGFLPTRESGTTDILTNTLGAALGAILCDCRLAQSLIWDRVNDITRLAGFAANRQSGVTAV
jgi:hypothetical protein